MFCLQLMVSNANAQAEAFAAAGDVSALAAAGNGAALAATGDTGYVQPIIVAFTSLNPYNAAQACASALNANEAAAIAAAFSQVHEYNRLLHCTSVMNGLKVSSICSLTWTDAAPIARSCSRRSQICARSS